MTRDKKGQSSLPWRINFRFTWGAENLLWPVNLWIYQIRIIGKTLDLQIHTFSRTKNLKPRQLSNLDDKDIHVKMDNLQLNYS